MLILTRRAGEAILIDGGIRIVVLGIDGGGVRIGIEAPASVGIVREEVTQRRAKEESPGPKDPVSGPDPSVAHPLPEIRGAQDSREG